MFTLAGDNGRSRRAMESIDIDRVTIAESITVTEEDIIGDLLLCEPNYKSFAEKCYMEVSKPMNFTNAEDYCRKTGGGQLVSS